MRSNLPKNSPNRPNSLFLIRDSRGDQRIMWVIRYFVGRCMAKFRLLENPKIGLLIVDRWKVGLLISIFLSLFWIQISLIAFCVCFTSLLCTTLTYYNREKKAFEFLLMTSCCDLGFGNVVLNGQYGIVRMEKL